MSQITIQSFGKNDKEIDSRTFHSDDYVEYQKDHIVKLGILRIEGVEKNDDGRTIKKFGVDYWHDGTAIAGYTEKDDGTIVNWDGEIPDMDPGKQEEKRLYWKKILERRNR